MSKVTFLGGGSFGISLAILLANKGNTVAVYDRDNTVVEDININRRNDKFIKGLDVPKNVTAYNTLEEAIVDSDYVVLAVPSHVIRSASRSLKGLIDETIPVICIAKGIEEGTNKTLVEVIEEEIANPVVILSGPSHAEEVAFNIPTTVLTSARNMKVAEEVQDLFMTKTFRVYTNDDLVGVEVGGAVKNIIALAAGICDGLGYGDNTKAALMTRGMAEIVRIGTKLGGKIETFLGLTGMGDLIVTCTSMHSRNRRAGYLIGTGKTREEAVEEVGMVVEGIKACYAFYNLKENLNVEMPITDALYKVLFEGKDAKKIVGELLERDKKAENY
ncbi:MAG: NAD(P)H-dependent glycerol-3-phosphate dehydrogenase [uncultured Clostridium sp.]